MTEIVNGWGRNAQPIINEADYARERGWHVGTILAGAPIIHRGEEIEDGKLWRITAIGEKEVLCVDLQDKRGRETTVTFSSREWKAAHPAEPDHSWVMDLPFSQAIQIFQSIHQRKDNNE